MKRNLEDMEKEIKNLAIEYDDLCIRYPFILPGGAFNNIPPDIDKRKKQIAKRIDNLYININQAKMKNMNK